MKTKRLLILVLFIYVITPAWFAQRGNVAAGGDASGSGGNVSYSIGQPDYITAGGSGGIENQGLQQPYSISEETGIEITGITLNFVVYPVPTFDDVTLDVSGVNYEKLKFNLMSIDGKVLRYQEIGSDKTLIQLRELSQGAYKLNVYNSENKIIKSFNIIKN